MPNYFYIDPSGQKQGPINDQQLQELVAQGIVVPETSLETESGYKGLAGQIPGLNFVAQAAPNVPFRISRNTPKPATKAVKRGSIRSWLFDFAFRDIRLPTVNLWACRIVYGICLIAALFALVFGTFGVLSESFGNFSNGHVISALCLAVFGTLGFWIGVFLLICTVRLLCEWYIIIFDWIVETTKAARIYAEQNKAE